jgi:hypothetical protein
MMPAAIDRFSIESGLANATAANRLLTPFKFSIAVCILFAVLVAMLALFDLSLNPVPTLPANLR